jgi:hypothetical protein
LSKEPSRALVLSSSPSGSVEVPVVDAVELASVDA